MVSPSFCRLLFIEPWNFAGDTDNRARHDTTRDRGTLDPATVVSHACGRRSIYRFVADKLLRIELRRRVRGSVVFQRSAAGWRHRSSGACPTNAQTNTHTHAFTNKRSYTLAHTAWGCVGDGNFLIACAKTTTTTTTAVKLTPVIY